MDRTVTLAYPLERVFRHLASPACLGDWLPGVTGVLAGISPPGEIGASFAVVISQDGTELPGSGELIAYEPPWCVAFRLVNDLHTHVLRLTCESSGGTTRVHVHQSDDTTSLAVDLARLQQAMAGRAGQNDTP